MTAPETPLPAPSTKHLDVLDHPIPRADNVLLHLSQVSSTSTPSSATGQTSTSTGTTGTTLWLGAQVMACYLADILHPQPPPPSHPSSAIAPPGDGAQSAKPRRRVLELGSGVGYLSLCLAYWGYEVIGTDIEPVLSSVLSPKLAENLSTAAYYRRGTVLPALLDWVDVAQHGLPRVLPPSDSGVGEVPLANGDGGEGDGGFEFMVTTDTLYAPSLVIPLWTTLRLLSLRQSTPPPIYLALENRDPALIDSALNKGREIGFELKRIAARRVEKAVNAAKWGWNRGDWEGVEVWKARYKP